MEPNFHAIEMSSSLISFILFNYSFEREVKAKLQAKSSGSQSEEMVLQKAFKYFDLNNNGTVEPDEFAKAIEKIGIMIPTKSVSYFKSILDRLKKGENMQLNLR